MPEVVAVVILKFTGNGVVSVAPRAGENATGDVGVEIHAILLSRQVSSDVFKQAVVDLVMRCEILIRFFGDEIFFVESLIFRDTL